MSESTVRVITRISVEEQAKLQSLPPLKDGETWLRYRDVVKMHAALKELGNRMLPTRPASIHVARCIRTLQPFVDEFSDEQRKIKSEHAPDAGQTAGEGDKVSFKDAIGMTEKLADLEAMVCAVKLPSVITDASLPVNSKAVPNNETGLAALTADLGPLYEIDEDETPKKKAEE